MLNRVSKIRNIRTLKALRGDPLEIDLGKTFEGVLEAQMKMSPNSEFFRSFDIKDNRFLILPAERTRDYYNGDCLIEAIEGKWYFDVERTDMQGNTSTIYTGLIIFYNDITNSNGTEAFTTDFPFNIEGGCANSIYLESQALDQGSAKKIKDGNINTIKKR